MQHVSNDVAELAGISRELRGLRRRVVALHAAMITGGVAVFERSLHGVAPVDRPRFLPHWTVILVGSIAAIGVSTHARARIGALTARARRIARGR